MTCCLTRPSNVHDSLLLALRQRAHGGDHTLIGEGVELGTRHRVHRYPHVRLAGCTEETFGVNAI